MKWIKTEVLPTPCNVKVSNVNVFGPEGQAIEANDSIVYVGSLPDANGGQ